MWCLAAIIALLAAAPASAEPLEVLYLSTSAEYDQDRDGLSATEELTHRTDPMDPDSDSDGLSDGLEVLLMLDPLQGDSDQDSLSDNEELLLGTDPREPDTDSDGLLDGEEVRAVSYTHLTLPTTPYV